MNGIKRLLSAVAAAAVFGGAAVSCEDGKTSEDSIAEITSGTEPVTEAAADVSGQTIVWLADYDLNPANGGPRSTALSLFEDVYGANVKYEFASPSEKYDRLSEMIISGEQVDMFPYEEGAFPNGALNEQYAPLDPYFDSMGMAEDGLWDGMTDVIEKFGYNGQHYVVPYALTDPQVIIYSRNIMSEQELEDPYQLYLDGKWDWNKFMELMEAFVAKASEGEKRYGLCGSCGQALLQSTGRTVVSCNGTEFANNISDPAIEKAELFMQEIASKGLYRSDWENYYPTRHDTLFFAAGDWALGESNAMNPNSDIMVVPFPKAPDADKEYLCCDYAAKMLVRNSTKGAAVAAYIKCERIAAAQEEYKKAAKQAALAEIKTASGKTRSFVTEEQYDVLQSLLDPGKRTPLIDFGYGMGARMYGEGDYNYETSGVMNKLTQALLEGEPAADSWETLRDSCSGVIYEEVGRFNS